MSKPDTQRCASNRSGKPSLSDKRDSRLRISIKDRIEDWCSVDNAQPGAQRLLPMEGLRGLAVFLVFLVHYNGLFGFLLTASPVQHRMFSRLALVGHSGVDLFFVMSGFLIYAAALKPNLNYLRFMKRRIVRIYPPFLAVFGIYLLLSYRFPEYSKLPANALQAALYISENLLLLPGILAIIPIITVAWSLSYEMVYYLLLPLITLTTGLRTWTQARRIVVICCASLAFYVVCWLGWFNHVQFLMFFGGILLYELRTSERLQDLFSRPREIAVAILFAASLGASAITYSPHLRTLILYLGIVPFTLFCFRFDGWIATCFRWWPLRAWGNISYSYYLLHGLILNGLAHLWLRSLHAAAWYWLFFPFALLITIIGSFLLFVLVERPLSLRTAANKKYTGETRDGVPPVTRTVLDEPDNKNSTDADPRFASVLESETSYGN